MRLIILAGGKGLRLWPLSTPTHPKQFVELVGGRSFLAMAIERALKITSADEIFIVTGSEYKGLVEQQLATFDEAEGVTLVCEPEGKNTAAAIALGLNAAYKQGAAASDDCFLVLSSDHLIRPDSRFIEHCRAAEKKAQAGSLVAFGAPALRPETGYGYLKPEPGGCRFIEKPDSARAQAFIAEGGYMWNCGMFAFQLSSLVTECEVHLPALAHLIYADDPEAAFKAAPAISFDHGIMERSRHVHAIALEGVEWSDVGSWDEIYQTMQKDEDGNVCIGDVDSESTRDSLVIAAEKPIALVGVEGLCVIDTPHALLVADLKEAQDVKKVAGRAALDRGYTMERFVLEPSEERFSKPLGGGVHWIIVDGLAEVEGEKFGPGQTVYIPAQRSLAISNQSSQLLEILEVSLLAKRRQKVNL